MAQGKGKLPIGNDEYTREVYLGMEAKDDFTDEIWRQRTAPVASRMDEEDTDVLPTA
jgi:hypothetical protein